MLVLGLSLSLAAAAYWKFAIPSHRIVAHSELIMLGDLDRDHRWTAQDTAAVAAFLTDPSRASDAVAWRLDLNQNGLIDGEDLKLLQALVDAGGDPYAAEAAAQGRAGGFPRPRELYRYVTLAEYRPRPLWALPYAPARDS